MLFFGELLFLTERCFAGSKIHASSMDGGEPSSNGKMCSVRQNMWLSYQVHYLPFFNHFFMGMTLNGNNLINWFFQTGCRTGAVYGAKALSTPIASLVSFNIVRWERLGLRLSHPQVSLR